MSDTPELVTEKERQDMAIEASADALLSVCALQAGTDPETVAMRALDAIQAVVVRAQHEAVLDQMRRQR